MLCGSKDADFGETGTFCRDLFEDGSCLIKPGGEGGGEIATKCHVTLHPAAEAQGGHG